MTERRTVVGVLLFVLAGLGASATLMIVLARDPRASSRMDLRQWFASLADDLRATAALRRASDVVVDREPSGMLVVSGRAVGPRRRFSSTAELKAFLKTLPTPGIAVVEVAYERDANGIQGLVIPEPAEARRAERELVGILEEVGFRRARGSVKTFVPDDESGAGRRASR